MNDKTRVQIAFITTISCLGASLVLLFMMPLPRVRLSSLEHLKYHLFLSIPLGVDLFILLALRVPPLLKERKEKKEKETRYNAWKEDMTDLLDFEKEMKKQHESDKEKARKEHETLMQEGEMWQREFHEKIEDVMKKEDEN